MIREPVVSNASPLIALEQIGQLNLLRSLFEQVLVPPAVAAETAPSVKLPSWVRTSQLAQDIRPHIDVPTLGRGEREAISLALDVGARWVILDDRPARNLARASGLQVIGTLGILLTARRRGLVVAVRPLLDGLRQHHFHLAQSLYDEVLREAGES